MACCFCGGKNKKESRATLPTFDLNTLKKEEVELQKSHKPDQLREETVASVLGAEKLSSTAPDEQPPWLASSSEEAEENVVNNVIVEEQQAVAIDDEKISVVTEQMNEAKMNEAEAENIKDETPAFVVVVDEKNEDSVSKSVSVSEEDDSAEEKSESVNICPEMPVVQREKATAEVENDIKREMLAVPVDENFMSPTDMGDITLYESAAGDFTPKA